MEDKICPLMSRPIKAVGHMHRPTTEIEWVTCQKENCQLWSLVYTTETIQVSGCALEIVAHKTQDGKYAV